MVRAAFQVDAHGTVTRLAAGDLTFAGSLKFVAEARSRKTVHELTIPNDALPPDGTTFGVR